MVENVKPDEKFFEVLKKKLEERYNVRLSDLNQYQIIELWVNKSCK